MSERSERWDGVFAGGADPWRFRTDPYEQAKFQACVAALPRPRYGDALELGCAGGAFTRHLAEVCDRILALDVSEAALDQARAGPVPPGVAFARAELPGDWPGILADLVVFSEVLYYFAPAEIARLAQNTIGTLRPGGDVLLVNWLGETGEALSGNAAAELFVDACPAAFRHVLITGPSYRLDLLRRPAAAGEAGR